MIDFSRFDSLFALATYFSSPKRCKQALAQSRWADGDVVCPYCGRHHCYSCSDGRYKCPNCKVSFSVTVGTIFENTKISLVKWFMAMYLISSHKKGISSCQLARDIKVTQKTAWYILHKLRTLYAQDDSVALDGEVECDEMYLGGREKNKHQNKKTEGTQGTSLKTKSAIFGMAERTGRTAAFVVKNTKSETLRQYIEQFVSDNASIFTDESSCYSGLSEAGYNHSVSNTQSCSTWMVMSPRIRLRGFGGISNVWCSAHTISFRRDISSLMWMRQCIDGIQEKRVKPLASKICLPKP